MTAALVSLPLAGIATLMQQGDLYGAVHDGECATRDWPKPEPFTWCPGFDIDKACRAAQHRLAAQLEQAASNAQTLYVQKWNPSHAPFIAEWEIRIVRRAGKL